LRSLPHNFYEMVLKEYLKLKYKSFIFRLSANNSPILYLFHTYFYSPSKGILADFYNQISKAIPSIFVIQVGANDGINHDPIHKYVKRDKWRGLLIEPQTSVFRNKLFPLYLKNPSIQMENVAIADSISLMDMYRISFCNDRWANGLTTFEKETLQKKVDDGDIERIARKKGVKVPANYDDYIERFKVECKTFDFLRAKYEIGEVDVLQVDVEGFDYQLIKLYDLSRNKPKVIVFESKHLDETEYAEAMSYFKEHGYEAKRLKGDTIAVRQDFKTGIEILGKF
jgi:FkbM family methyltransferase